MRITKLKSGSYRVQKQINGHRVSLTFDHKPKISEVEQAIAKRFGFYNGKLTFEGAANNYIDARTNILSPSTAKDYRLMIGYFSTTFQLKCLDDITNNDIQKEINSFAQSVAPKTVKNRLAFVSAILGEFRPDFTLRVNLPMQVQKKPYIPTREEVKMLLDEAYGTKYETALYLGCCSIRRGEICALTMDDIDFKNNIIHINKDTVLDENKKWVVKTPKTLYSIRDIKVPDEVLDSIKRNGLYKGHPGMITKWMKSHEQKLGLPTFTLHKLRHYFASTAHEAGVPDADIMAVAGWASTHVMKKHYTHAQNTSAVTETVLKSIL